MKSVLLIDGSSLFKDFLHDKFSTEQVTLEYASNREAYTKMLSVMPDLIIIELQDNQISEIDSLLEKKHRDPNARKIPVFMTGPSLDRLIISRFVEFGVVKFFTRPIKFEVFFESLGKVLATPFFMDSTPCILDLHLNGSIIFVEIAQGLNREKLMLLKYRLSEIITKYRINVPKVILMLTNLELSFVDGSNLELLLNNITAGGKVANKFVKILSFDEFVKQLVKGHPEYHGMTVSQNLQYVISSLMNQDADFATNDFIYDNILNADRPTDDTALGFSAPRNSSIEESNAPKKIAIIDDDVVIRKLLENTFSQSSFETALYANATDFINAVNDGKEYDLLILDLYLPDMDGITVLNSLKHKNYNAPILVYSKAAAKEFVVQCLTLGAKAYLVKPQKPDVIKAKALEIINSSR